MRCGDFLSLAASSSIQPLDGHPSERLIALGRTFDRVIATVPQRVTTTFAPLLARSNRSVMSSLYIRMQP
jgi:hypothetical protein